MTTPEEREPPNGESRSPDPEGDGDSRSLAAKGRRSRSVPLWLLAALIPTALVMFFLGTDPGRQLVWDRVASVIEARTGWKVSLDGMVLGWDGWIFAHNVVVTTPEGAVLARVDDLAAHVPPLGLRTWREAIKVRSASLGGLWIDLAALPESEDDAQPSSWQLEVSRLSIDRGRIAAQSLATDTTPGVIVPLGTEPLTVRAWSAQRVAAKGRLSAGRRVDLAIEVDGDLELEADGLRQSTFAVAGGVRIDPDHALRLDQVTITNPGLAVTGSFDCTSFDEGPCVVEGVLRSQLAEILASALPSQSSVVLEGRVDLLTWLGEGFLEAEKIPVAWIVAEDGAGADSESSQVASETTGWLRELWVSGRARLSAGSDPVTQGADLVRGNLTLTATSGASGPVIAQADATAAGGALDEHGRLDLRAIRFAGELLSSDDSLDALAPLIPEQVRVATEAAGLATAPYELSLLASYVPESRRMSASGELHLGASCPRCATIDVRASEVTVELSEAGVDWTSLRANAEADVARLPGAALRQWLREVGAGSVADQLRLITGSDDSLAASTSAQVRNGELAQDALRAEVLWERPIGPTSLEDDPDLVGGNERLLTLSARSRDPNPGRAALVEVEMTLLPEWYGERHFSGLLDVADDYSAAGSTIRGQVDLDLRLAQWLDQAAPFAGDQGATVRQLARVLDRQPRVSSLVAVADLQGSLLDPEISVDGEWLDGEQTVLSWQAQRVPASEEVSGRIAVQGLLVAPDFSQALLPELIGTALAGSGADRTSLTQDAARPSWLPDEGNLSVDFDLQIQGADVLGSASLEGTELAFGDFAVEDFRLAFRRVEAASWLVDDLSVRTAEGSVQATGSLLWPSFTELPESADLAVATSAPRYGLEELEGRLVLEQQSLNFVSARLRSGRRDGSLSFDLPLPSLALLPSLAPALEGLGVQPESLPVVVALDMPLLRFDFTEEVGLAVETAEGDLALLNPAAPVPVRNLTFRGLQVEASLRLDALQRSRVEVDIRDLEARYAEFRLFSERPVHLSLVDSTIVLDPVLLEPRSLLEGFAFSEDDGPVTRKLNMVGSARLAAIDLSTDVAFDSSLVQAIELDVEGPVDLAMVQSLLAPAEAGGMAVVDLRVRGPLDDLEGEVTIVGEDASLRLLDPYVTRFDQLRLRADIAGGGLEISDLSARLNQGSFTATGSASLERVDLAMTLERVRYRVDYGLSMQISGAMNARVPFGEKVSDERGRIDGELRIDHGLARRELDLDRELRTLLFAPGARPGEADPLAQRIDLNLDVTTLEGIRVRNNVADLRATWDELRVRGTLAEPLLQGTIEAESGGLITAYGQIARVDLGELRFLGQPGVAPEIELETTTSLEDPTIRPRQSSRFVDPFSSSGFSTSSTNSLSSSQAFTGGLADYFGNQLATSLGEGLGQAFGGAFNVRPVLVFGETEPSARLIVTREIDENLDVGVSLELRNPEDRLYLLDVHELAIAPSFSAQVFTNEQGNEGATLQQNLELGGTRSSPLVVGDVRFDYQDASDATRELISERRLRRDLQLSAGDEWFDSAPFDAEVDVTESLRDRGFPSPEAEVEVTERNFRRDLLITVRPGDAARIEFEGLIPGKEYRQAIRLTYRNDFFQEASLLEMQKQTRIALEAQGWFDARVVVEFTPSVQSANGVDLVVLRSEGTRKVSLDRLAIEGLDREGAAAVDAALDARGSRVALAQGDEAMRSLVLDQLASLGWLEAMLKSVAMTDDGKTLEMAFERGRRARIADIRLVGIDDTTARGRDVQELAGNALLIAPGDPVVQRELAGTAIAIENLLRDRGYGDASVDARVVDLVGEDNIGLDPMVEVTVNSGSLYRIAEVEVPEDGASSTDWVRKQVQLEAGDIYDRSKLRLSRSRLLSSGVFSSVSFETIEGSGDSEDEVTLALRLRERPRWSLAYGLRWESEERLGAVIDLRDRNFLGRGFQLGTRALWTERRKAARVFAGAPRFLGSTVSVDTFVETQEVKSDGVTTDVALATFQVSLPLTPALSGRGYFRYREDRETDTLAGTPSVLSQSPVLGTQLVFDVRSRERGGQVSNQTFSNSGTGGSIGPAAALFRGLEGGLGTFASLDLSASANVLGSDYDYVRAFAQVFYSRPAFTVGERQFVWAQSWRLGVTDNRGRALPRDQRFFAGGEYSVRGYGREQLGPQETIEGTTRAAGGEAVFILNQELRFPVVGDFEGVVMLDAGNVWEDPNQLFDDLFSSVGLGARYRSPIGLLRLDVAVPLKRREGDDSFRFYLGLGHVF